MLSSSTKRLLRMQQTLQDPNNIAHELSQQRDPINVTVTGGTGHIGYILNFFICQGKLFGSRQPINITILSRPQSKNKAEGVMKELDDCAFPLLRKLKATSNLKEAFENCDHSILVGARPRKKGMVRADLLKMNANIFKVQGSAMNAFGKSSLNVLLVANPANTNALITSKFAPKIPKRNFQALTRLDQNRTEHQVCKKLNTFVDNIKNIVIWGNHSASQYPDVRHGYVNNYPQKGLRISIESAINDDNYIKKELIPTVQKRGGEIIRFRQASSAASAANAICDHIYSLHNGTKPGQYVAMGVISDENCYGIPDGIYFSFPCTVKIPGKYELVCGLPLDEDAIKRIKVTTQELLKERETVFKFFSSD